MKLLAIFSLALFAFCPAAGACDIVVSPSVTAVPLCAGSVHVASSAVVVPHVQVLAVPSVVATQAFVHPLVVQQQVIRQQVVQQRLGIFSRPRVRSLSINRTVVR